MNYAVGYGIGVCMPLCMSWVVSHLLGVLMAPLCGIFLSGYQDSFLFMMSQILGHLCVVVVGI